MFTIFMGSMILFIGIYISDKFIINKEPKKLLPGSIPIADLVKDFEEYARLVEGGELTIEANEALNVLKKHVEQKLLPAQTKPLTFAKGYRQDTWSDGMCFEKEVEHATTDDERLIIINRWMKQYTFTQSWQTWCINGIKLPENRDYLRKMFEEQ